LDAYGSFRFRDYRLLLAGNFLATLAFQMLSVAVSWDLYLQTKSALVLGNVGFVQVTPFLLFALFAGHFADTHDRRRILTLTQLVFFLASALLATLTPTVFVIYGCLFLTATARTFQGPARSALIPNSVPPELLRNAISWASSANEIASVSGPAVTGFLLAYSGSRTVYIVQGLCALGAFVAFYCIRPLPLRGAPQAESPGMRSLLEGVAFVWRNKLVLSAMSLDLFAVLFGGATTLLPIYAVEILHTDARGLGWLRAAPSLGAVSMALLFAHAFRIRRAGAALLWSVVAFGIATIVFGISRNLWLSFGALILVGAFDNVSVVLRHSLIQSETPDYVRGRVLAVNNIFINCSNQLGAVESGWAAALLGTVPSVVAGACVTILIVAMFATRVRQLREWRH
jgi:MFS family permease